MHLASPNPVIAQLSDRLAEHGLLIPAAFNLTGDDALQPVGLKFPAATLLLIGNVGSSMWQDFSESAEYLDGLPDPLDRWSIRLADELSGEFGAVALFPFGGPPYHPFLSWAAKGEPAFVSPLGLTLHPEYGLWHAYRFALAFMDPIEIGADHDPEGRATASEDRCLSCKKLSAGRPPCLSNCPIDAFTDSGYRVRECAEFLARDPEHECNLKGCLARRACPVGQDYRYQDAHAQFHMRQFVINHIDDDAES